MRMIRNVNEEELVTIMEIMSDLVKNMTTIHVLILYLGAVAFLCILEIIYIRKRSKMEKRFPFIVLGICCILFIFFLRISPVNHMDIRSIDIKQNNETVGVLHLLTSDERKLLQIGQFVTNEGTDSAYLDLNIAKGKITLEEIPNYAPIIETNLKANKIDFDSFDGTSVIYKDLLQIQNGKMNYQNFKITKMVAVNFFVCVMPALILYLVYLIYYFNRKKKNLLLKSKLKDL